jgi:hypothetical protein
MRLQLSELYFSAIALLPMSVRRALSIVCLASAVTATLTKATASTSTGIWNPPGIVQPTQLPGIITIQCRATNDFHVFWFCASKSTKSCSTWPRFFKPDNPGGRRVLWSRIAAPPLNSTKRKGFPLGVLCAREVAKAR